MTSRARLFLVATVVAVVAGCGGQTQTVTVTTPQATVTSSRTTTSATASTTAAPTASNTGSPVPPWVQAAKAGCPTGETPASNGGCVGSGSSECATSEPTCNPVNAPGTNTSATSPAPTATTQTQIPTTPASRSEAVNEGWICQSYPATIATAGVSGLPDEQGYYQVATYKDAICMTLTEDIYSSNGSLSAGYTDPLKAGDVPPSGFYSVDYNGEIWIFQPVGPSAGLVLHGNAP